MVARASVVRIPIESRCWPLCWYEQSASRVRRNLMIRTRGKLSVVLAFLLLAGMATPVRADQFSGTVVGYIFDQQPVTGGTMYTSYVTGDMVPLGSFEGFSIFTIRGAAIQESFSAHTTSPGNDLYLYGEGQFLSPTLFYGVLYVVGGTGQYQNATGSIELYGEDLGGNLYYYVFDGTINL